MTKDWLTIAFTWGGTGGHVFPIVSLIQHGQKDTQIQQKCKQLYWIWEVGSMEALEAIKLEDTIFLPVLWGKLRRYRSWRLLNILDIGKIIIAFFQSLRYLCIKRIDVVVCKGGYVALPVCLAAKLLGKRIVLHESDLHPGLTNRIVAKFADHVFSWFPQTLPGAIHVWQVMSDDLAYDDISGLDIAVDERTHVLVMGWSQWSEAIFTAIHNVLGLNNFTGMVFHIIGGTKNTAHKSQFDGYDYVHRYDFLSQIDIAKVYSVCDISITRGGVTSLAEQELFGIKKIIIPHPDGGGYHQFANALWYSDSYEDIVVEQDEHLAADLSVFLSQLAWYRKNRNWVDITEIQKAKTIIWQSILV